MAAKQQPVDPDLLQEFLADPRWGPGCTWTRYLATLDPQVVTTVEAALGNGAAVSGIHRVLTRRELNPPNLEAMRRHLNGSCPCAKRT